MMAIPDYAERVVKGKPVDVDGVLDELTGEVSSKSPNWEAEREWAIEEADDVLAGAERWRDSCQKKLDEAEAGVVKAQKRRERALAVEKAGA